jgi:hypothetical protein
MTATYWTYQPGVETPTHEAAIAAGAIAPSTTAADWCKLSPGMRREIVRQAKRFKPEPAASGLDL